MERFDPSAVFESVTAFCRRIDPGLEFIRISFGRMGVGESVLTVPESPLSEEYRAVLEAIRAMPPGTAFASADLADQTGIGNAEELDAFLRRILRTGNILDSNSGGWRRRDNFNTTRRSAGHVGIGLVDQLHDIAPREDVQAGVVKVGEEPE